MPVKDLTGSPPPTVEELALIDGMWKRYGPPLPQWLTGRDGDEPDPVLHPFGPRPDPMPGGAELDAEDPCRGSDE